MVKTLERAATTVDAADLSRVLASVLPHAGKARDMLPVLEHLQVTVAGGRLSAAASDRYTIGSDSLALSGNVSAEWVFLLHRDDAAGLVRSLRPHVKRHDPSPAVQFAHEVTSGSPVLVVTVPGAVHRIVGGSDNHFPKWQQFVTDDASGRRAPGLPDGQVALTPDNLTRFAVSAKQHDGPVRFLFHHDPERPEQLLTVQVRIGDTFRGAVQPVKVT